MRDELKGLLVTGFEKCAWRVASMSKNIEPSGLSEAFRADNRGFNISSSTC